MKSNQPNHPVLSTEQPRRIIGLSTREYERLLVLQKLASRDITQKQAAEQLGLGTRQVRMLLRRYSEAGAAGLISRHRGRRSNRAISAAVRDKALKLIRQRYAHLGPTRVREHLANRHGISVSVATISNWMTADGIWQPRSEGATKPKQSKELRAPTIHGRHVPLFDAWVLDTEDLVATAVDPKGVKRLKLIWYEGTICWCEASGRFGRRQLQRVLDETRRQLCPETFDAHHWYVPEHLATPRNG